MTISSQLVMKIFLILQFLDASITQKEIENKKAKNFDEKI